MRTAIKFLVAPFLGFIAWSMMLVKYPKAAANVFYRTEGGSVITGGLVVCCLVMLVMFWVLFSENKRGRSR